MALSKEEQTKLAELIDRYGEDNLGVYTPPGLGLVVLAPPEPPEEEASHPFWRWYAASRGENPDQAQIMSELALACVVYPEKAKVVSYFRRKPGAGIIWCRKAKQLCGDDDPHDLPLEGNDAATVQKLRVEHGDVSWFQVEGPGLVVLAAPENPAAFRQFFNDCSTGVDQKTPHEVVTRFVLDCVVYPARESVAQALRRRPGLAVAMSRRCQELCGGELEEVGKASSLLTTAST